jgi:DNA polymerase
MTNRTPVKDTIYACDDLIEFQKIVKLSSKYEYVMHNNVKYNYKCYRVFASTKESDGKILKCRDGNNPAKFGNTPDRCFVDNSDINGKKIPAYLDLDYYVELATKRLSAFGVKV